MTTSISKSGIDLIKHFEAFKPKMYKDAIGLPTIGYGTLIDTKEEQYLLLSTINEEQATNLLLKDVKIFVDQINKLNLKLNQNQFDAVTSFVYNTGFTNFKNSTLLKKMLVDPNDLTIKSEFDKWVYADHKKLDGLVKRRKLEGELYFKK